LVFKQAGAPGSPERNIETLGGHDDFSAGTSDCFGDNVFGSPIVRGCMNEVDA